MAISDLMRACCCGEWPPPERALIGGMNGNYFDYFVNKHGSHYYNRPCAAAGGDWGYGYTYMNPPHASTGDLARIPLTVAPVGYTDEEVFNRVVKEVEVPQVDGSVRTVTVNTGSNPILTTSIEGARPVVGVWRGSNSLHIGMQLTVNHCPRSWQAHGTTTMRSRICCEPYTTWLDEVQNSVGFRGRHPWGVYVADYGDAPAAQFDASHFDLARWTLHVQVAVSLTPAEVMAMTNEQFAAIYAANSHQVTLSTGRIPYSGLDFEYCPLGLHPRWLRPRCIQPAMGGTPPVIEVGPSGFYARHYVATERTERHYGWVVVLPEEQRCSNHIQHDWDDPPDEPVGYDPIEAWFGWM